MEPPEIERLDERTVQRIAAGEVVERPASVVKELIENSLDAGASRVAVSVEAGGTEGVRVRDDGVGIPADQLEAAVAEHATSKIADIEDLDAGVGTLGFRGEALYTIGAVSRLTVRSKPLGADAGAEVTVEGGTVGEVRPAGCPRGTTVEVEDLFYNTPAREKFLKRVTTEFDHVNTVVTGYALANPDVAVSLEHDGRETFATEGNGDLRSAVLAVYGREVAESMVDVDWEPDGPDDGSVSDDPKADLPVTRATGLVSHPETTRSSRDYLATYVNGRYVTAGALRKAVLDAYGGQLAPDRYPFAVLFVEVPPDSVDVNVHPRKLEVRFDAEPAVRSAVESAVESALLDDGLVRSTAPRGRSAPDETEISPESPDAEAVGGAGIGDAEPPDEGRDADVAADPAADPDDVADHTATDPAVAEQSTDGRDRADTVGSAAELSPDDEDAWTVDGLSDGVDGPGDVGEARPSSRDWQSDTTDVDASVADSNADASATDVRESASTAPEADDPAPDDLPPDAPASNDAPARNDATRGTRTLTSQRTLAGGETTDEREYDSLPPLRVLGQLHGTYVVAEDPDGLVLIDQHAADERVNYERLREAFAGGAPAQALAEPVTVKLTAREAALFGEFVDDLAGIGFRAERTGDREVVVEAVPAVFDAALDPELLRDALSSFVADATATRGEDDTPDGDGDAAAAATADIDDAGPVTNVVDDLLADLACYPSVTGNTSLTEGRVVDLFDRLDACENPYACPHGRPVVIRLDHGELESRFERDYPGHGGRRRE